MFDDLWQQHVAPQIADVFGGTCTYMHPIDSGSEPVDLDHVMIGDIRTEKIQREHYTELVQVRYFQMITDRDSPRFCGVENPVLGGRILVGKEDNCEEWPIAEKPTVDSDGFTKVKTSRFLRHETGNPNARGRR